MGIVTEGGGRREGPSDDKCEGHPPEPGASRGPGENVGGSRGPAEAQGETPRSLRARRGAGTLDGRYTESGLMRCSGPGPAPSPSRGGEVARPVDGHEPQAAGVADRAPGDVHARQPEREGDHGLRRVLSRTAEANPARRAIRGKLRAERWREGGRSRRRPPGAPRSSSGDGVRGEAAGSPAPSRGPSGILNVLRFVELTTLPAQSGRQRAPRPVSPKQALRLPACTWRAACTGRRQRAQHP